MRVVPTWSNGQLAFAHYIWRDDAGAYLRHVISVLSLRGREIAEMVVFRSEEAFDGFDLPERIEP